MSKIRDALKKHEEAFQKNGSPLAMSLYLVRGIVQVLDRAIERLKQFKPKEGAKAVACAEDQSEKGDGGDDNNDTRTADPV